MSKATVSRPRIAARVEPDTLEAVRRAAARRGQTVSAFVAAAVDAAARQALAADESRPLSPDETAELARLLASPPEPNEALRRAGELHARLVS